MADMEMIMAKSSNTNYKSMAFKIRKGFINF